MARVLRRWNFEISVPRFHPGQNLVLALSRILSRGFSGQDVSGARARIRTTSARRSLERGRGVQEKVTIAPVVILSREDGEGPHICHCVTQIRSCDTLLGGRSLAALGMTVLCRFAGTIARHA